MLPLLGIFFYRGGSMKKIARLFMPALVAGTMTFPALASKKYGMAGCGLGSLAIGPNGSQIFAATTNGTSSSQSWGIISGTSNCTKNIRYATLLKQKEFLSVNLPTLQKEMAQGKGETLNAFVEVLGCKSDAKKKVSSVLTKSYRKIFSKPGIEGVLHSAKEQILMKEKVAKQCTNLDNA
jgi:hypothetical protein